MVNKPLPPKGKKPVTNEKKTPDDPKEELNQDTIIEAPPDDLYKFGIGSGLPPVPSQPSGLV